jgi:hypothetical protein
MEAGSCSVLLKYMLSLASDVGVVWFVAGLRVQNENDARCKHGQMK